MIYGGNIMNLDQKFYCNKQNCKKSCCGAFDGVSDRIAPIDNRSFKEIVLTLYDLEKIIASEFVDYIYIAKDGLGRVKTKTDGSCLAYESGQCLINDVKPTICRSFPLYLDIFVGLCTVKDCTAVKDEHNIKSYQNEIKYFLEMCEFWMSYYRKELEDN